MKTKNMTFSIPIDIANLLHSTISKRELSKFAAQAIKKALEQENEILRKAYADANNDPGQIEAREDWASLDNEGWD